MKSYTLGIYEKALPELPDWESMLRCAKQVGYDFLEMSIDETEGRLSRLNMSAEQRQALCEAMGRAQLPIRSMCLSAHRKYPIGSHQPQVVQRGMEIMRSAIELADDLGIRVIMLAGYDVYYEDSDEETRRRFAENLRTCADMAAQKGVLLAFETMETPFMNTVEKAMSFVRQIDSPFLQVYPDIGNVTNAVQETDGDVIYDLCAGRGHLAGLHLKETSPGVFRNLMYGDGYVNFEQAIHTAWKLGVRRYVTEFWYQGEADWLERAQFACQFARRLLNREVEKTCCKN